MLLNKNKVIYVKGFSMKKLLLVVAIVSYSALSCAVQYPIIKSDSKKLNVAIGRQIAHARRVRHDQPGAMRTVMHHVASSLTSSKIVTGLILVTLASPVMAGGFRNSFRMSDAGIQYVCINACEELLNGAAFCIAGCTPIL